MTTPDILEAGGFKRTKIGKGDKQLGYAIERSQLRRLSGGAVLCLGFFSTIGIVSQFELHLERRTFHRKIRKEEHHAASKLAHVEMELWSHYRDDIKESHEAKTVLNSLSASHDKFQGKLKERVASVAVELGLQQEKADALTNQILHLVAELQSNNTRLTKPLIDHLVNAGKKSVALEKHAEKEALKDVKEEEERMNEDEQEGNEEPEDDEELKPMLQGFFDTFHDHEKEFSGQARIELSKTDSPIYQKIVALRQRLMGEDAPNDEDFSTELDGLNLASIGVALGEGRMLMPADMMDELFLIPVIPLEQLRALEKKWKDGKKDADGVFQDLLEMQTQELIPAGWLNQGVDREEDEEEREEEREEDEENGREPNDED